AASGGSFRVRGRFLTSALANGSDCTDVGSSGCASGFCAGSVCCNSGCTGTSQSCQGGTCTPCGSGTANCDGLSPDACEISPATNPSNCGACGNVCSPQHSSPTCSGGSCGHGTCNVGFGDCDDSVANGCETNTSTSTTSCGGCGNVCGAQNSAPT